MAVPFPQYSKIKNRYCIAYYGPCAEYIVQLLYLRPAIEKEFPGIEIYISCRDDCIRFIDKKERIIFGSELNTRKKEVAYIRELRCDLKNHPVLQLIQESNLQLSYLEPPKIKQSDVRHCVICTNAILPTGLIHNIDQISNFVFHQGYSVGLNSDISKATWVIGPENEQLFTAAIQGIRTTLIPTGLGTELYKKLFPDGEIYF